MAQNGLLPQPLLGLASQQGKPWKQAGAVLEFLLQTQSLSSAQLSSWLLVRGRKLFCCSYRRLFILRAKPFDVSTTGRLLQYKAEITPVQSRDYSSTTGRLLQYFTVVLCRLRRCLPSTSPLSSTYFTVDVHLLRRWRPPIKGFESLTLVV